MTDGPDEIARKIKKATSDSKLLPGNPKDLLGRPEAKNLMEIYASLSNQNIAAACAEFEGKQFSVFKNDLTELAVSVLGPIGAEMARLVSDVRYIDAVLKDGSNRASMIANKVLAEVYDTVGFLRNDC